MKLGYTSGFPRLRPDVCEVQRGHGLGQAHQHVQLHLREVLGRLEVQIRSTRQGTESRVDRISQGKLQND